jgi:hypothetical protein
MAAPTRRNLPQRAYTTTVHFFATGSVSHPDKLAALSGEETRVLNQLRAEGTVVAAYRRVTGGVVGVFQGASLVEVQAQLARLPFVANGYLTFEYVEAVEL